MLWSQTAIRYLLFIICFRSMIIKVGRSVFTSLNIRLQTCMFSLLATAAVVIN